MTPDQQKVVDFLNNQNNEQFQIEFNSNPAAVMTKAGLTPEQQEAINEAGEFKSASRTDQEAAIDQMFSQLGLVASDPTSKDAATFSALRQSLVDNYNELW